jgi:phosphate transport system substrate-binding protein
MKEMPAIVQVPELAGRVCITYNLPDLQKPLQLSGASISGIFLGSIKSWQDPAIRKDNPGVNLHDQPIAVAHRSDGSGTTNIFTTYLAKVSPDWKSKVGQGISVNWPVGIGGKGSEGVTGVVKQTPGAIAYVELNYATENKLPIATVRNQAGKYIAPSPESTTAAIEGYRDELAKDVRTPIVDPPASAADAYPISGLTFLLIPKQAKSPEKAQVLKDFVQFIITQGQANAASLQYSPLPQMLQAQDQALLAQVQGSSGQ